MLGNVISGVSSDIFEKRTVMIAATGVSTVMLFLLSILFKFLGPFLFVYVLIIIAERLVELAAVTYVANLTKRAHRGRALSYVNMVAISSMGVSTLSIGFLVDKLGYPSVFLFLSFTMLSSGIIALTIPTERRE
jgi:MFS family permease